MAHPPRLMLISGEVSADNLGAELMLQMARIGYTDFFGIGGEAMEKNGCRMILSSRELMVFGIAQAITSYVRLRRIFYQIEQEVKKEKPVAAILIDSAGFNLRLMKRLRSQIPFIIQMVSPQFWATRYYRIRTLQKNVDLLLTLFSFEAELSHTLGIHSIWVGHPLIRKIPRQLKTLVSSAPQTLASSQSSPAGNGYCIGLFPGSRPSEIRRILPRLLHASAAIQKKSPTTIFLLSQSSPELSSQVDACLKQTPHLRIQKMSAANHHLQMLTDCDMVMTTSGTICLEAAYFLKPMIAVYFLRWFDFFLLSLMLRCRFFCMVNILAGKRVITELIQTEVTSENILKEVAKIRFDKSYCQSMKDELAIVKKRLGSGNPSKKAAQAIQELIS